MSRTFGQNLRAHRLGYRWVERLRRYVRIRDAGPDLEHGILVDLSDGTAFPQKPVVARAWWEDPGLLDASPYLRALTPDTAPTLGTVHLDQLGLLWRTP